MNNNDEKLEVYTELPSPETMAIEVWDSWLPWRDHLCGFVSNSGGSFVGRLDYIIRDSILQAHKSPDLSTQNGAAIFNTGGDLLSLGCNTMPNGIEITPDKLERPKKYKYTVHAERKSIFEAAKCGKSTLGSNMFCLWYACEECAQAIIDAGIQKVIGHPACFYLTPDHWREPVIAGFEMLHEARVRTLLYDAQEVGCLTSMRIRFNGKYLDLEF